MSPVGRPEIGQPINIRLTPELLTAVDSYAEHNQRSRADAIRLLLTTALVDTKFGQPLLDATNQPPGHEEW